MDPFVSAAKLLKSKVDAVQPRGATAMLAGGQETLQELEDRWAGSVVHTSNDKWLVVPAKNAVSLSRDGNQIRLGEQGTFAGRLLKRNAAWLASEEVSAVYRAAVTLPEGGGKASTFVVDGTEVVLTVQPTEQLEGEGEWTCTLSNGSTVVSSGSLASMLIKVGAVPTPMAEPAPVAAGDLVEDLYLPSSDSTRACVEALDMLGFDSADKLNGIVSVAEVAGALVVHSSWGSDGRSPEARLELALQLLSDEAEGREVRLGVGEAIAHDLGAMATAGSLDPLVEEASSWLQAKRAAAPSTVQRWPAGACASLAVDGALLERATALRARERAEAAATKAAAVDAAAAAARQRRADRERREEEEGREQRAEPRGARRGARFETPQRDGADGGMLTVYTGGGAAADDEGGGDDDGDDDEDDYDDDDDYSEGGGYGGAPPARDGGGGGDGRRGGGAGPGGRDDDGGRRGGGWGGGGGGGGGGVGGGGGGSGGGARGGGGGGGAFGAGGGAARGGWSGNGGPGVLARVVPLGQRVHSALEVLEAIGDECGDVALGHLRRMLAKANGERELAPTALLPDRSEGAAIDTRADVEAVLVEASKVGFGLSRGASWGGAAAQLSNLCTAAHTARRQAAEPALKAPKEAGVALALAKSDADKPRAVAAEAVAPLARRGVLLGELQALEAGQRDGNALQVAEATRQLHGAPAVALYISNGKTRSELPSSGVAAPLASTRGRLVAWAQSQLGEAVGELRVGEAAADIRLAAEAVCALDVDEASLERLVRLLGGKLRTRRWKPSHGGVGWGAWGVITNIDDVKKAVGRLARLMSALYGRALGMPTGVGPAGDASSAFGLVELVEAAAESLPTARVVEALLMALQELARLAGALRDGTSDAVPCLQSCVRDVRKVELSRMEDSHAQDERTDERVEERVKSLLAAAGD